MYLASGPARPDTVALAFCAKTSCKDAFKSDALPLCRSRSTATAKPNSSGYLSKIPSHFARAASLASESFWSQLGPMVFVIFTPASLRVSSLAGAGFAGSTDAGTLELAAIKHPPFSKGDGREGIPKKLSAISQGIRTDLPIACEATRVADT